MSSYDDILVTLRQIVRTADRQAKRLARETGLTVPQLMVLQTMDNLGTVSIGRIAAEVNLTQATVTAILDGLVKRGLVYRKRSETDKRMVHALPTEAGMRVLEGAPPALRQHFLKQLDQLEDWEKSFILAALQRVVQLMDADELVVAPLIDPVDISAEPAPVTREIPLDSGHRNVKAEEPHQTSWHPRTEQACTKGHTG